MVMWNRCAICGRAIPVGELCYGVKNWRGDPDGGDTICRDCLVPENSSALTPPNEWVRVEERLPEPDFPGQQRGFYLVALSNGTVKELMYEFRHYENMMFGVGWHETAFPVTHWMLLPAPPDCRPPKEEMKDASN